MKRLHKTIPGILACGLLTVLTCRAATPTLSFKITFLTQSQKDEPKIKLENTSPVAQITGFKMTIGKTSEDFDFLQSFSAKAGSGVGYSNVIPDEKDGGKDCDCHSGHGAQ